MSSGTVILDGQGVALHDTRWVCPGGTTTYALRATGGGNTVERTVTLNVNQPVPSVSASFSADSTSIVQGQCTNLRWNASNAQSVSLDGRAVAGQGSSQVCPGATTTYGLRAVGAGGMADRSVTVVVNKPAIVDNAQFIADVSVPDGTAFEPGKSFVKTWRVKNTGNTTWTTGYQLAFVRGDRLGATSSVNVPKSVAPGGLVDISVNMTAPTSAGTYSGSWSLRNARGASFGQALWVKITVTSPSGAKSICGQAKWATSCVGNLLYPVIELCGSASMAYLWQPSSFNENAYYRLYDPVVVADNELCFKEYQTISRLTGWSSLKSVASCDPCEAAVPAAPAVACAVRDCVPKLVLFTKDPSFLSDTGVSDCIVHVGADIDDILGGNIRSTSLIQPLRDVPVIGKLIDAVFIIKAEGWAAEIVKANDGEQTWGDVAWTIFTDTATTALGGVLTKSGLQVMGLTLTKTSAINNLVVGPVLKQIADGTKQNASEWVRWYATGKNWPYGGLEHCVGRLICKPSYKEFLAEYPEAYKYLQNARVLDCRGASGSPATPTANAVIKSASLNLRSGPGTTYAVLGSYVKGTSLEVLGKNAAADWLQVKTPDGKVGWMAASSLQLNISLSNVKVIEAVPPPPPPAPAGPLEYYQIALGSIMNDTLGMYAGAPTGNVVLGGVPFNVAGVFGTQGAILTGRPTVGTVNVSPPVANPTEVFILINSGATYSNFMGKQLGTVDLSFTDGSVHTTRLVVGENIREWSIKAPDVVRTTTSPSSKEVYREDESAVLDMLSIAVPVQYRAKKLAQVTFTDTSASTAGSLDPGFFVAGVAIHGSGGASSVSQRVESSQGWQNTGIWVGQGDTLTVSATGSWTNDANNSSLGFFGPGGQYTLDQCVFVPEAVVGMLVAKIGAEGPPFAVGSQYEAVSNQTGYAYLAMNEDERCDMHAFENNAGFLNVTVRVNR